MPIQHLWEYYSEVAKRMGQKRMDELEERQGRDGQGEEMVPRDPEQEEQAAFPQSNFSLYWYFKAHPQAEELDPLTRAFLGDQAAMDQLDWEETTPEGWEEGLMRSPRLDDCQVEAVRTALRAPLTFIQGPPGTGKTETILNLASCAVKLGKTMAIVSTNNSALNNIAEKIKEMREEGQDEKWAELGDRFAQLGNIGRRQEHNRLRPDGPQFQVEKRHLWPQGPEMSWEGNVHADGEDGFMATYLVISSTIHSLKRCFADGMDYLYDYVVMDESSQTNTVVGLVAMSCARHLILVGDPKQLPPVIQEDLLTELEGMEGGRFQDIPSDHAIQEDRSFLDVCLEVFRDRIAGAGSKIILRNHYRCHPEIFRFCVQEIYKEERLIVCTPRYDHSVQVPIKVLWFEGNYCEQRALPVRGRGNRIRTSKHNQKQVRCFMEEEWPRLRERIREEDGPSVCILSPYRGQLASLDKAIREDMEHWPQEDIELRLVDAEENERENGEPVLSMLTVHKSQGRGYDIIYLLPVEDGDWEWPWSQNMRLVNVAVSRAKKELRVILSSALMGEQFQRELTGGYVHPQGGNADPEEGEEQRFLQKLVGYVRERNRELEETGFRGYPESEYEFGFHRSARRSVYDRIARQQQEAAAWESGSAPEACMERALEQLLKDEALVIYRNMPLRGLRDGEDAQPALEDALPQLEDRYLEALAAEDLEAPEDRRTVDQELRDMYQWGHLDFAICKRTDDGRDRLLMAIEVDGGYHRTPGEPGILQQRRDRRKDALIRGLFHGQVLKGNRREDWQAAQVGALPLLRMPTDGTTCLETRALWSRAPGELQGQYFPLEEVLEAQLGRPEGEEDWYISTASLGATPLEDLCREEACREKSVTRACRRLGMAEEALAAAGRPLGLISVARSEDGELSKGLLYTGEIRPQILGLLNDVEAPRSMLEGVFEWFTHWMDSQDRETAWKEMNDHQSFKGGKEPDYSLQQVQALYLLRYQLGYAYEYRELFRALLAGRPDGEGRLKVLSLGCGNMTDYWGLRTALRDCPQAASGVDYIGVDLNGWAEEFRFAPAEGDTAQFIQADAVEWLRDPAHPAPEVYLLPKSISEFGRTALAGLAEGIRAQLERSGGDRVELAFALRPRLDKRGKPIPGEICEDDRKKCEALWRAVERAGYLPLTDADAPEREEVSEQSLAQAGREFVYPSHILDRLGEEGNARTPILSTQNVRRVIYRFEKRGE